MTDAPSVGDLLSSWSFEPGLLITVVLGLALYGWGVGRVGGLAWAALLGRAGSSTTRGAWPVGRAAAFALGVLVVVVALSSGLDGYAESLLSVHMAQHLALALVAAPLLVAGAAVALALRALPRGGRRALAGAIRSRPARVLTHPLVAWTLFAATMIGTHLTGLYALALRHPAVHVAEHVAFLGTAILFWLPVLGAEPVPHRPGWTGRMLYLLTAMPAMGLAGVVLSSDDHVRYAAYLAPARHLGVSALADQHVAGAMMWVGGSAIAAVLTLIAAWSALIQEERRALAREAHLDGAR